MIELTVYPNSAKISLIDNVQTFRSDLSGYSQYSDLPGARWGVSLSWFNRTNREGRILAAQLASLNGPVGILKLPVPDVHNYGTAAGSGKVSGANQSGNVLLTSGWTPNQTELFEIGDWIECNQQVFQIAQAAASDASGNAALVITPAIRRTPANGQDIIVTNPSFYLRRISGNTFGSDLSPSAGGPVYAFGIEAIEID